MKKFIITESERNTIRQMYGLNEQTTTTTPVTSAATPTTTTTIPVKTPMFGTPEQRAAAKAKRVLQQQKNSARFAASAKAKNMTVDEYSEWLTNQSKLSDVEQEDKRGMGNDKPGCSGSEKNNADRLEKERKK